MTTLTAPAAAGLCLACPLCASVRIRTTFDGIDDTGQRVTAYRCRDCAIVFNRRVNEAEMDSSTASAYSAVHANPTRMERIVRLTADIRATIRRYAPRGTLLDVGCGLGEFLGAVDPAQYERVGLEPNPFAAQFVRDRLGTPVVTGLYDRARFADRSVDVIVATQVLEHVAKPRAFLAAAHAHLKPGGLLVIDVPGYDNPKFLLYRLTGWRRPVRSEFIRCHLFYYTRRTLARLLREEGFAVRAVRTGRYRAKLAARRPGLAWLAAPVDWLANALGVGGVTAYATKGESPDHDRIAMTV